MDHIPALYRDSFSLGTPTMANMEPGLRLSEMAELMPDLPADFAERWAPAIDGKDPEDFHIALARHQVAANRAGRLRSGALLGGKLVVARIDAGGIGMRTLDAFSPA